jgi:hypothetical protein
MAEQKTHEEMLNIPGHRRNANQSHLTSVRFHLTSVRTTTIKNTNNEMLVRMWENGTLIHCWWECKLVQPLW